MSFLVELGTYLQAAGVGSLGTNIFLSTKAAVPSGAGPYLSLIATGGAGPEKTHDAPGGVAYQRPTAQVLVRATSYPAAEAMLAQAYNAVAAIRNQALSGTWYLNCVPQQEAIDLGAEEGTNRVRVAFNVIAWKRPS